MSAKRDEQLEREGLGTPLSEAEREIAEAGLEDRITVAESGYSPPEYTCQRCGAKRIGWACDCYRFDR